MYMITNQEWERLEILLDTKLEQKLEQKLDQKLDQKFDQKLGDFAILMKNAFDEVHDKIDRALARLDRHDVRISANEQAIDSIKRVIRI
jgi:hypothetical protein